MIKIGILIRDKRVLIDTILTESAVSQEYLFENIVVIAAVGALPEITEEISIVPLTPQRYITKSANSGKRKSLMPIAKKHLMFLSPSSILLFIK